MIGVFVHEAEVLEMDFLVSHPVVKVHAAIWSSKRRLIKESSCFGMLALHNPSLKVSLVNGDTGELVDKTEPGTGHHYHTNKYQRNIEQQCARS